MILVIDAGTSRLKIAIMDSSYRTIAFASEAVAVSHPFVGACEIDMPALWAQVLTLLKQLRQSQPQAFDQIQGIGITGQGDGMWGLDESGNPVRPAILWNDTRVKSLSIPELEIADLNCCKRSVTPNFAGGNTLILRWLKEEEPDNYRRIAHVLHCKDYLNYCLTGEIATEASDASTAMINIFNKTYVKEGLDELGIGDMIAKMPPVLASKNIVGSVQSSVAEATGLPVGTPVIAGAIDVIAVCYGAGASKVKDACIILGTTLANGVVIDKTQAKEAYTLGSILCHVPDNTYLRLMSTLNGTASIEWARDLFMQGKTYQEIEEIISPLEPGAAGIIYHPYLYGERAPVKNSFACGSFIGLRREHGAREMMRAVYEGIVLSVLDCLAYLPETGDALIFTGGGAKSNLICQMVADATGKQVKRPNEEELGLLGMARSTWEAIRSNPEGFEPDFDRFEPNLNWTKEYQKLYRMYVETRQGFTNFWQERDKEEEK
jgi:sugar (pentulose or hexulose) kinase